MTIVFLARFDDALVVFSGSGDGPRRGRGGRDGARGTGSAKILSPERIKYLSIVVFLAIGIIVIVTTIAGM